MSEHQHMKVRPDDRHKVQNILSIYKFTLLAHVVKKFKQNI